MLMHNNTLPSVMKHDFSRVPQADIQRSSFDRSHGNKTTFDAGDLVPVFVDEVLPADTFNLDMAGFGRLATPLFPVMDNMFVDSFFFFVPSRLLWENWQRFHGERDNPDDSIDYLVPQVQCPETGFDNSSLFDYMGLPTNVDLGTVNALIPRAYNLIWNEWFRDENLQDSVTVNRGDGPDSPTDYNVLKRGKRHDYLTSCLPFPQKGDAVQIPIGDSANVIGESSGQDVTALSYPDFSNRLQVIVSGGDNQEGIIADLSTATATTINQLREAFQVQRLLERDARGGTRYTEMLKAHFGVTSPDARLQRPEYLGGGTSRINVNPIPQTSSTDDTSPQGNLAAQGQVSFSRHGFTKSFTEHGYVIGLVSLRADLNYQQGVPKMWDRKSRYDFYYPALAHLGEQAVLSREIYADGSEDDNLVFGYQERFAEYRYKNSTVTGQFRSNFEQSLDAWHLSQYFGNRPVLNDSFIQENPPIDRVIAVPSYPHLILDTYFKFKCARAMPTYSVPGLIDHF